MSLEVPYKQQELANVKTLLQHLHEKKERSKWIMNYSRKRDEAFEQQKEESWRQEEALGRCSDEMMDMVTKSATYSRVCAKLWLRARIS